MFLLQIGGLSSRENWKKRKTSEFHRLFEGGFNNSLHPRKSKSPTPQKIPLVVKNVKGWGHGGLKSLCLF